MISQAELKKVLHYDPLTGVFTWLVSNSPRVKVGAAAGCISEGYVQIGINGKTYRAHQLAWVYMYGGIWNSKIDHINRKRDDNRIVNLRNVSNRENALNRASGHRNRHGLKWVYRNKEYGGFDAKIIINGKLKLIGTFATPELAHQAASIRAQEYRGEFFTPD